MSDIPIYPYNIDDLDKYSVETNDVFFRRSVEMIEFGFNNDMNAITLFRIFEGDTELFLNLHYDMWESTLVDAIQHFEYVEDYEMCSQAKDILENPIFIEAVNKIRSDLANEWLNSDVKNSEQRENIFIMRRMLELVVMQIQSVMETGKIIKK